MPFTSVPIMLYADLTADQRQKIETATLEQALYELSQICVNVQNSFPGKRRLHRVILRPSPSRGFVSINARLPMTIERTITGDHVKVTPFFEMVETSHDASIDDIAA